MKKNHSNPLHQIKFILPGSRIFNQKGLDTTNSQIWFHIIKLPNAWNNFKVQIFLLPIFLFEYFFVTLLKALRKVEEIFTLENYDDLVMILNPIWTGKRLSWLSMKLNEILKFSRLFEWVISWKITCKQIWKWREIQI